MLGSGTETSNSEIQPKVSTQAKVMLLYTGLLTKQVCKTGNTIQAKESTIDLY